LYHHTLALLHWNVFLIYSQLSPKKREGEERVDFSVSRTLLRGEKAAYGVGVVLQTLRVNPHQFETVYRAVLDGSPEFQYVVDVTMIDVP
jgi:hypothetical protein